MIVPCDLYNGALDNYMIFLGQIAEGTYNFTSTSEPSQIIGGLEDERVAGEEQNEYENDDKIHILDGVGPSQRRDEASSVNHNWQTSEVFHKSMKHCCMHIWIK
jgi:hypothetical protein